MNYLIFCSFEVGGFPYAVARTLNKYGIAAYYISVAPHRAGYDSDRFHHRDLNEAWNLSGRLRWRRARKVVGELRRIKDEFAIGTCWATGRHAYLLKKAGIPYKYFSYGSDLDQESFALPWSNDFPLWKRLVIRGYRLAFVRNKVRASIAEADSVMIAPYQLRDYRRLFKKNVFFFLPHFRPVRGLSDLLELKKKMKEDVCGRIGAGSYFFSSTRHFWSRGHETFADFKGNNIMLRAFSRYLKISGDQSCKLVLVKKGPDWKHSFALARQEGIAGQVVWVDEMKRDDLDPYYLGASLCLGQFGTPVLTNSVIEPLSYATPCASFIGTGSSEVPFYADVPPVFNSSRDSEIAGFMVRLMSDRSYGEGLSRASWQWVKDHCSEAIFVKEFTSKI